MKPWIDTLPDFLPPVQFRPQAWSLASCSEDFAEELRATEQALQTLLGRDGQPISLFTVSKVTRDLLGWFAHPFTQHHLTYPFTEDGLVKSIGRELLDGNSASFVLACLYPEATMRALQSHTDIKGNWSRVGLRPAPISSNESLKEDGQNVAERIISKKVAESVSKSSVPQTESSIGEIENKLGASFQDNSGTEVSLENLIPMARVSTKKEKVLSEFVLTRAHQVALMIRLVEETQAPLPVQQEHFNGLIKQDILSKKGTGSEAANYWLEDTLLPALSGMKADQMQVFLRLWGQGWGLTFNHPASAMRNGHFWQNLANMQSPDRQCFVKDVLPNLVHTSEWSFRDRLEMLQAMVEKLQGKSWLLQERLGLWMAWGGDLDEEGADPTISDEGFLRSTTTARRWLTKQGLEGDAFGSSGSISNRQPAKKMT